MTWSRKGGVGIISNNRAESNSKHKLGGSELGGGEIDSNGILSNKIRKKD